LVCINFKSLSCFNSRREHPHWIYQVFLPSQRRCKFVNLYKSADSEGEKADPC